MIAAAAVAAAAIASCYSPDYRGCRVRCTAEVGCPGALRCLADGWCAATGEDCGAVPDEGGVGGDVRDADVSGNGGGDAPTSGPAVERALVLDLDASRGVEEGPTFFWRDQSPNHNDAWQTGLAYPTLEPDGAGPHVHFDGRFEFLQLPDGFADFSAGLTFVVVARLDISTTGTRAPFLTLGSAAGGGDRVTFVRGGPHDDLALFEGAAVPPPTLSADAALQPGWHLWEVVVHPATPGMGMRTTFDAFVDGAQYVSEGAAVVPPQAERVANYIGRGAPDAAPAIAFLHADLLEMCLYSRALDDAERAILTDRMRARWNLP